MGEEVVGLIFRGFGFNNGVLTLAGEKYPESVI